MRENSMKFQERYCIIEIAIKTIISTDYLRGHMKHIFIVNTHAGDGKFSEKLRNTLAGMKDFDYFIFNTRKKQKEDQLVKKIIRYFKGEKLRIYSCGGSGTFRNILNSIDNLDNVELAFYPCGMTNDFLKVFEEDEKYFHSIKNLIDGEVRMVDFIQTDHGRALNTFSLGMDTDTLEGLERFRPFSTINGKIPYMLSIIYAIFSVKNIEYQVSFDGDYQSGQYFEVFFGNGSTIGGTVQFGPSKCANNGVANTFLGPKVNTLTILPHLLLTNAGKPTSTARHGAQLGSASEMTIKRADGKPFAINYDGEVSEPYISYNAKIVKQGLAFVVPKQVTKGFMKEGPSYE